MTVPLQSRPGAERVLLHANPPPHCCTCHDAPSPSRCRLASGRRAAQEKQRQQEKAVAAEEEARMTLEIAEEVKRQVEAAMASPEVAARIQQRLKVCSLT
jgi:hypothetical protein